MPHRSLPLLRRLPVLSLVGLTLLLGACAKRETNVSLGNRTQTLHIGNGAEPRDLDPQIITAYTDYNVVISLFEGLTVIDEASSRAIPGTAASWDISPDGLVYTFHLRPGAKWSNGDPVTAQDFLFSYQRMLSPGLASEYAYMLYPVKNAEAFNTGHLDDFSAVGFSAPDAHTFVVTLSTPTPSILAMMAHQAWFPVHPPTILKYGRIDERGTAWTRPGHLVGNGAFNLVEWSPNSRIIVEKSDTYWNASATRLHRVVFYPNENIATDEANFRSGQLHITYDVLPDRIQHYQKTAPNLIRVDPLLETFFIRCNVTTPPLDDVRVRRALGLAIDREAIARSVLYGSRLPAHCLTPPNTAGYTARASMPTDFDEARRLLAAAGFPGGQGFPTLTMQSRNDSIFPKIAEAMQAMWRRELGIKIEIAIMEQKVWLDNMTSLHYQLTNSRWIGDYNDPQTYLDMFVTGGGNNQTGWSDPDYDGRIEAAARAPSPEARFEDFQQAEARLLDRAPILPVFFGTRTYLIQPSVKGWVPSILGIHRYQTLWLEP